MLKFFRFLYEVFTQYQFETLILFFLFLFLIVGFYNKFIKHKQGTWSTSYYDRTFFFDDVLAGGNNNEQTGFSTSSRFDSKGEVECRRVLEKIFQKPFPKKRPSFLHNHITDGSHNLELDCFNEELGIACEYHGKQHYDYVPYFHRSKDAFYNQKYRDDMKRRLCKENNIVLIEVPYTVKLHDIEGFIERELMKI